MKKYDSKKIVYIDMDDTLCDFKGAFDKCILQNVGAGQNEPEN